MKTTTIYTRLLMGLGISIFILVSSLRASLDDILEPLSISDISVVPLSSMSLPVKSAPAAIEIKIEPAVINRAIMVEEEIVVINGILSSDVLQSIGKELEYVLRPNGEITLIPLRSLPDLSTYAHPFSVTLMNPPGRLSRGSVLLSFQVENEKGVLGQWNVPFRAHLYSDVWFARARLRSGDLASASDFEIRQVDLLLTPDAVPASLEMLLRHEYSRDVIPGKALTWNDLVERSLIRKGDVVEVSSVQGLLAITVRAIARQDGSSGDLIVFRNIDTSKEFAARVTGESRAEIIF